MAIDEKYKLSTYKEISVLLENTSKKICIVNHEVTNKLYVKKVFFSTEYYNFYARFASLKHINLIDIHDVIGDDGTTYVFEEYINGQTLQALIESEGALPESKAVDYVLKVCDALIYLHSQDPPIIHRDIKPDNIMLSADGVIKLVDFDIAREFKQSAKRDTTFMGTKEYAAPEQYGYQQTDGRTDIYAIGVLLYELLTGKLPQNDMDYKGALQKIIVKCMRLEPEQRYQSVSVLKKALAHATANRYKKLAVYALPGIAAVAAIVLLFQKTAGYEEHLYDTPPASVQTTAAQAVEDEDTPPSDVPAPTQTADGQDADDKENTEPSETPTPQIETDQDADGGEEGSSGLGRPPAAQTEVDQNGGDEALLGPEATASPQPDMEPNPYSGEYYADFVEQFSSQTLLGEKFADIVVPFLKVEDYSEKPTILLEQKAIDQYLRRITGGSYDAVAGAFQHFDDSFWEAFYDPDLNLLGMAMCNYQDEVRHDRLLLEVSGNDMNVTFHDADKADTYYFTTADDKGLLSAKAYEWIKYYPAMYENPVVFDEPPVSDVTGSYYLGNKRRIDIFEEAGEVKFSYTDIRVSKDAEPWMVETIQKIDANHYWIKTYLGWDSNEMLIFNFSKNHLTLLNMMQDSDAVIYNIAESGYARAFDPKGIYDKK